MARFKSERRSVTLNECRKNWLIISFWFGRKLLKFYFIIRKLRPFSRNVTRGLKNWSKIKENWIKSKINNTVHSEIPMVGSINKKIVNYKKI